MINNLLDGVKGIGKFLGIILWLIGVLPYKASQFLFDIRFSSEIKAEEALLLAAATQIQAIDALASTKKEVKKRAPRKKKVVETVALVS